jgi:hypothetical protein
VIEIDEFKSYDNTKQQGDIGDEEAKKVKFCLMGPLNKIHNIIIYIRDSIARVTEFSGLVGRLIPLDNHVR